MLCSAAARLIVANGAIRIKGLRFQGRRQKSILEGLLPYLNNVDVLMTVGVGLKEAIKRRYSLPRQTNGPSLYFHFQVDTWQKSSWLSR